MKIPKEIIKIGEFMSNFNDPDRSRACRRGEDPKEISVEEKKN